jgi:hypothetical protein
MVHHKVFGKVSINVNYHAVLNLIGVFQHPDFHQAGVRYINSVVTLKQVQGD